LSAEYQPVKDKYRNFADLDKSEKRGDDFRVRSRVRAVATSIIAPHGGGIEPGGTLSFYAFEGTKARNNLQLHITSTNFDEPSVLALVAASDLVVAIHGEDSDQPVAILGGRDKTTVQRLSESLQRHGFPVQTDVKGLQGCEAKNICNRGAQRAGVQIELSKGLRRTFFKSLENRVGRQTKTERFWDFVAAVRKVIA
jgi:phage replication-related protein YjqB (UPF0714/DUF867 family)